MMYRILISAILIFLLLIFLDIYESVACPACCGSACSSYEEEQNVKLTRDACEKMKNDCYDSWTKRFIAGRIKEIRKIKKTIPNKETYKNTIEPHCLTLKELLDDYKKDKELAEKKYKDKLLVISGRIVDLIPEENIISIGFGKIKYNDEDGENFHNLNSTITCNDIETEILNKLKKNREITIKGFYQAAYESYGLAQIFYFNKCIIENN